LNKKVLLLIGKGNNHSSILKKINSLDRKVNDILALSWDTKMICFLKDKGIDAHTIDDYSESYHDVFAPFDTATKFLRSLFFKGNFRGTKEVRLSLLLDLIAPYLAVFYVSRVFSNLNIANFIIRKENPHEIILLNFNYYDFLQNAFICWSRGKQIKVEISNYYIFDFRDWRFFQKIKPFLRTSAYVIYCFYQLFSKCFRKKEKFGGRVKKILFAAPSGPQIATFVPLVTDLSKEENISIQILCTSERSKLDSELEKKVKVSRFSEYSDIKSLIDLPFRYVVSLREWRRFKETNRDNLLFMYQGISIENYFYRMIEKEVPSNFDKYLDCISKADKLLRSERPDSIITTEDPAPKIRSLLIQAKEKNIPTVNMQYGAVMPHSPDIIFGLSDYFFISGECVKDYLLEEGIMGDRIKAVGMPRIEYLLRTEVCKEEICKKYDIDEKKKIILVASNACWDQEPGFEGPYTFKEYIEWLEQIYDLRNKFPDCELVVKPHHSPRDPVEIHNELRKKINGNAIVVTNPGSTSELISICDILITWVSTTAIEAILMDKNVISFNLSGRDWQLPFVKYGAALEAVSKENLHVTIKNIINGNTEILNSLRNGRQNFLKNYFPQKDKAFREIMDYIKEISQAKR